MPMRTDEVGFRIPLSPFWIDGALHLPERPHGLVVLAQGSGASRPGVRGRLVTDALAEAGFGTVRLDLVGRGEGQVDEGTALRWWDIHFLAGRLVVATDWLAEREDTRELPFGYLGVGDGASVALAAALARSSLVRAVVSLDGRPDIIAAALPSVTTPTLLVVEGEEADILRVNRRTLDLLAAAERQLQMVPGRALDRTTALVRDWLIRVFHPAVGAVHAAPIPSQLR